MRSTSDLGRQVYRRIVEFGESLDQVEHELISPAGHVSDAQRVADLEQAEESD